MQLYIQVTSCRNHHPAEPIGLLPLYPHQQTSAGGIPASGAVCQQEPRAAQQTTSGMRGFLQR
jgi:hypothetical protein